ncbi:uncharacterized protein N7496_010047 [Penicillium cataractarum]|uniref:Alpha/beta hydrolase fold-3 domain-containing protein n=1 Tax=Penicillium cataractarum TaxID=2100454 RepID=A0A9W9RS89_9EURO|nr:uncharacterized protein N7496_010047 [Penicillium cataractarum]KAJ5364334.1 hypothetical protein N7496_010047 [Penicillium cataractarum]
MAPIYAESWLQVFNNVLENAFGGRVALQGDVSDIRKQFAELAAATSLGYKPFADDLSVLDGVSDGVPHRIYVPKHECRPFPVGVYMHGGGYILGDLEAEDMICRTLCKEASSIIISVDYRLAPEHKHPAQLKDALAVIEWVYENMETYGGDKTRIYTIGTSAGAALALLAARDIVSGLSSVPSDSLCGVVAISPLTTHHDNIPMRYQKLHNSYDEFGEGAPVLTRSVLAQFLQWAGAAPDDASSFILLDDQVFSKFPAVYISTAECDPLRDDGKVLADAFREAGIDVSVDEYPGMPHCFWFFHALPEWTVFIKNTVAAISWVQDKKSN